MSRRLPLTATEMVIDFQHHYTPPELMDSGEGDGTIRLDENGNPNYRFIRCSPTFLRMSR